MQELKEKQKELEKKAHPFNTIPPDQTEQDQDVLMHSKKEVVALKDIGMFRANLPPLHRKPSTAAKPKRQQAVVSPLQGVSSNLITLLLFCVFVVTSVA